MKDKINDRRKSYVAPIAVIVFLVLLPMAYMSAYLALLDAGPRDVGVEFGMPGFVGEMTYIGPPDYRFGGETAESLFYPAYYIDSRYLRPREWSYQE